MSLSSRKPLFSPIKGLMRNNFLTRIYVYSFAIWDILMLIHFSIDASTDNGFRI